MQRSSVGLGDLMYEWTERVLYEFGIAGEVIIGISDAGSDVKSTLKSNFSLIWSWCMSHCISKACGVLLTSEFTPKFQAFVSRVKLTVNKVDEYSHFQNFIS